MDTIGVVKLYLRGNLKVLEEMFYKHGYAERCIIIARKNLENLEDCGSVATDVYMALYTKIPVALQEKNKQNELTLRDFNLYFNRIATNKSIDFFKRNVRNQPNPIDSDTQMPSDDDQFLDENIEKLNICIDKLNAHEQNSAEESCRVPLDSEFLAQMMLVGPQNNQHLQDFFGLSENQVRTTKQRIMRRLRRCMLSK